MRNRRFYTEEQFKYWQVENHVRILDMMQEKMIHRTRKEEFLTV